VRFHHGEGGMDFIEWEAVHNYWLHSHPAIFQELYSYFVLARHRAVRTRNKGFAIVNLVGIELHGPRIFAQPAEEIHAAAVRHHFNRLLCGMVVKVFRKGETADAGWNHFLFRLTRTNDRWDFAASSLVSQPEFLSQLAHA
jgi:hypothetical protein